MSQEPAYLDLIDINRLQQDIMRFVEWWVMNKKTPVPLKEIIGKMKEKGIKDFTTTNAINSLLRKHYIRRAIVISNKSSFVQLKRI